MGKTRYVLAAICAGLMIQGCSGSSAMSFQPEKNSIYIAKDGTISSAAVGTLEQDYYTEQGMAERIGGIIAEYNESQGAKRSAQNTEGEAALPVALTACTIQDKKGTAIYEYADSSSFLQFAQVMDVSNAVNDFGTDTVANGRVKGWLVDGEFSKVSKGSLAAAGPEEISKLGNERVVMVETGQPVTVVTEGKILYLTAGVTLSGEHQAEVPEGKHYLIFK